MRDRRLTELFLAFRDRGDSAALGKLFDATAPLLHSIARHLARDRGEAEDLVQATFLAAIESRERFDAARDVEPWLVGILANQAALARRRAARFRDVGRTESSPGASDGTLPAGDSPDAAQAAIDREVSFEIAGALRALPSVYREVVEARLLDGARGSEIASRLGRSPGVVRSQLHRGLLLLRRALPRGLVSSIAFAAVAQQRVKAAVLHSAEASLAEAQAGATGACAAAGAASASLAPASKVVGGLLMLTAKKLIVLAAAVVVCGASYLLYETPSPDDRSTAAAPTAVAAPADAATPGTVDGRGGDLDRAVVSAGPSKSAAVPETEPASYRRALAGVKGRLVEASGKACAGTAIELVELRAAAVVGRFDDAFAPAAPLTLRRAAGATDGDGRFLLEGAHPIGLHALGVDLGGPRATLKLVDLPLVSGAVHDLGDVMLSPVVALSGRITDEDGEPIAGARVRAAPLPLPVAMLGVERLSRETRLLVRRKGQWQVIEPPAWILEWIDRLPVPATLSSADGRFTLTGVAPGVVTAIVDRDGYAPRTAGPIPTGRGDAKDMGSIELARGRTLRGTVRDAAGAPVPGAIVAAGVLALATDAMPSLLHRETTAGADGSFVLEFLPDDGELVLAARREDGLAWQVFDDLPDDECTLAIGGGLQHDFRLVREDGSPVDDAVLRLRPIADAIDPAAARLPFAELRGAIERIEAGRFLVRDAGLVPGWYRAVARSESCGMATARIEIAPDSAAETTLTFLGPRPLTVEVTDAATGAAVEYAAVSVLSGDRIALQGARSDREGRAAFAPLAVARDATFWVSAEHPAFAAKRVAVAAAETIIRAPLDRGGGVDGRIRSGDKACSRPLLVALAPVESVAGAARASPLPPLLLRNDAAGRFLASGLTEGTWRFEVFDHPLPVDLTGYLAAVGKDIANASPTELARGEFEVRTGAITPLVVDIAAREAPRATIRGRVLLNGEPMRNAAVDVIHSPNEDALTMADVESDGSYVIEGVIPGDVRLMVNHFLKGDGGMHLEGRVRRDLSIAPGETKQIDFDLHSSVLVARVVANGHAVAGALVRVFGRTGDAAAFRSFVHTDDAGESRIDVLGAGDYVVDAALREHGVAETSVTLAADGTDPPVTLELRPGITIGGEFSIAAGLELPAATLRQLQIGWRADAAASEDDAVYYLVPVPLGQQRFTLKNQKPGKFTFQLRCGKLESREIAMEIDGSREDLKLDFEP